MKVSVVGTGYVGLVTGTCLAKLGYDVVCLDVDPAKIQVLLDGGMPIYALGFQDQYGRYAGGRQPRGHCRFAGHGWVPQ
jgi:UDPglucose 6-dehydrogenase